MKSFALFALACLIGIFVLPSCTLLSKGEGDSFWYQSSRTEMGFGRRNTELTNDATSTDIITVPALEDVFRVSDGDEGSRS